MAAFAAMTKMETRDSTVKFGPLSWPDDALVGLLDGLDAVPVPVMGAEGLLEAAMRRVQDRFGRLGRDRSRDDDRCRDDSSERADKSHDRSPFLDDLSIAGVRCSVYCEGDG